MQPTAVLPGAYTVRPPELGDAKALFELISAYNLAVVGFADCTLGDVADKLAEPGFDRRSCRTTRSSPVRRTSGCRSITSGRSPHPNRRWAR
jgi:hypothetical protein